MKLILSRKGFDASYGGMASPILPDGRLVPLPIPSNHDRATFADLAYEGMDMAGLLQDLSGGRHRLDSTIHLDPDLDRPVAARPPGWRPALGQTGAAQRHLAKQGVGPGDVFLFFGWFREVEPLNGTWRYRKGAPDLHVLFGWLEVADVVPIVTHREEALAKYPWCIEHAHAANPAHYENPANTLYIAPAASRIALDAPFGGGRFPHFSPELQLTRPGYSRTNWSLPACFMPSSSSKALSYHGDPSRWERSNDRALLRSAAKGQEFVQDCSDLAEAAAWITNLIRRNA